MSESDTQTNVGYGAADTRSARAVIDRIKVALDAGTDSDLARALPINRQTLGSWSGRNSVPYELCLQVADTTGVSLDWLLTGRERRPVAPPAHPRTLIAGLTEIRRHAANLVAAIDRLTATADAAFHRQHGEQE